MVCLIRAAMLSVPPWRLRRGLLSGLAGAMPLHFFGDFPIFLMQKGAFGLGQTAWQVLVSLRIQLYFFGGMALPARFHYGHAGLGRLILRARRGLQAPAPDEGFKRGRGGRVAAGKRSAATDERERYYER